MRRIVQQFHIIQVGVCAFYKDPLTGWFGLPSRILLPFTTYLLRHLTGVLHAFPYTFYIFPQSVRGQPVPLIGMEAEAIEFNRDHNMDFNKWYTAFICLLFVVCECDL